MYKKSFYVTIFQGLTSLLSINLKEGETSYLKQRFVFHLRFRKKILTKWDIHVQIEFILEIVLGVHDE